MSDAGVAVEVLVEEEPLREPWFGVEERYLSSSRKARVVPMWSNLNQAAAATALVKTMPRRQRG